MSDCVTVNSTNIAEVTRKQTGLKSLLGVYDLSFNFSLKVYPNKKERWAIINSARVHVKTNKSREYDLGIAKLEVPISLKEHPEHAISEHFTFYLPLTSAQLSELEDIRDGHDLDFKLMIKGEGGAKDEHTNPVHDEWRVDVPSSKWIGLLKQANYMDILLLEVPMLPKELASDAWIDIKADLEEAQRLFLSREYSSCIAKCRTVLEEAGHQKFGESDWCNPLLDLVGKSPRSTKKEDRSRSSMNKEERENTIWASLLHYTHQSHHGKSRGGENTYTRANAKLILTLTAAFISA